MCRLKLEDFQVNFKGFQLNVPHLYLDAGQIVGIIGRNASGKTTLLRAIAGEVKFSGKAFIDGVAVSSLRPEERASLIGYLPQTLNFSFPFTVGYALQLITSKFGTGELLQQLIKELLPSEMLEKRLTELSFGYLRLLGLAMIYLKNPKIALIDEPLLGLDKWNRKRALRLINDMKLKGVGLLVVTHEVEILKPDKIYLMQQYYNRRLNISVLKG